MTQLIFKLALHFGMTPDEVRRLMTIGELAQWAAYFGADQ